MITDKSGTPKVVLQKGIPIPSLGRPRTEPWPWRTMEIGDSFFVAKTKTQKARPQLHPNFFEKGQTPIKITSREVTEDGVAGWRIWRVS